MDDFQLEPPPENISYEDRRRALETRAREIRGSDGALFNEASWQLVLDLIEEGYTVEEINDCKDLPSWSTIRRWIRADPERALQYKQARELSSDTLESQVIALARYATNDDYRVRQFQANTILKIMAYRAPRSYGSKVGEADPDAVRDPEPMKIDGGLPEMPE